MSFKLVKKKIIYIHTPLSKLQFSQQGDSGWTLAAPVGLMGKAAGVPLTAEYGWKLAAAVNRHV